MTGSFIDTLSLRDRTALVTGAAGYIGFEICQGFAELGADLILVDRKTSQLHEKMFQLQKRFQIKVQAFDVDLEIEQSRHDLVRQVNHYLCEQSASLHILVNNAAFVGDSGLSGWIESFEMQSIVTWRRAMEVNLTAVFHLCQSFADALRKSAQRVNMRTGSIVNIGSIYGHCPPDWSLYEGTEMGNPAAYAVSKAGLHGLTTWLSTTLAPDIRVNTIAPSGVFRDQPSRFVERYKKTRPLGRMITEVDVAHAVLVYATDIMESTTGQVVYI